jgi:hypothetical protein
MSLDIPFHWIQASKRSIEYTMERTLLQKLPQPTGAILLLCATVSHRHYDFMIITN